MLNLQTKKATFLYARKINMPHPFLTTGTTAHMGILEKNGDLEEYIAHVQDTSALHKIKIEVLILRDPHARIILF